MMKVYVVLENHGYWNDEGSYCCNTRVLSCHYKKNSAESAIYTRKNMITDYVTNNSGKVNKLRENLISVEWPDTGVDFDVCNAISLDEEDIGWDIETHLVEE